MLRLIIGLSAGAYVGFKLGSKYKTFEELVNSLPIDIVDKSNK